MKLPGPAATRTKYDLLLKKGGNLEDMEPLEQAVIKFLPTNNSRFFRYSRRLKEIIHLHMSQPETAETRKLVAEFVDIFAERDRRQELARLLRQVINQAQLTIKH